MSTTTPNLVHVIHGPDDDCFSLADRSVGYVKASLVHALNVPSYASAWVNGQNVGDEHILKGGDVLEFCVRRGFKGLGELLSPAELMKRWKIKRKQYDQWVSEGLPTVTLLDGNLRHPAPLVDGWWSNQSTSPQSTPSSVNATPPRLTLDCSTDTITLDGVPYRLRPREFLILKCLHAAHGGWVSRAEMQKAEPSLVSAGRLDRTIKTLTKRTPGLKTLIDSTPRGYRLVM